MTASLFSRALSVLIRLTRRLSPHYSPVQLMKSPDLTMHDVIIVGGSYAGLAAALQLGRARRSVLVLDGGQRRNRFVSVSHGFLGQDGASPDEIAAKGKAEVLAYPTVEWG